MNRFIAFCFLALVLAVPASASPRVDAWLARHGVDPDEARASGDVDGVAIYTPEIGERVVYAVWPDSVPRPEEADLPTEEQAEVELSAFRSAKTAAKEIARQDAKPPRQKELENQYFAAVAAIAAEAGEPAPSEADAKDLAKVRASSDKARKAKDDSAGQGKKAGADDLLKLRDLQTELYFIDAELREYDPAWRKGAKKHQ